jgi:hypothetical protein
MSYSFIVRAADKAEAKNMVAAELTKVVDAQPMHVADRAQAQAVAEAFIDILPDDDMTVVQVNVHGSVSWTGSQDAPHVIGASVGVTASLIVKEAA